MNYLEAKTMLTEQTPRLPFNMIALEAAALVALAGILVKVLA